MPFEIRELQINEDKESTEQEELIQLRKIAKRAFEHADAAISRTQMRPLTLAEVNVLQTTLSDGLREKIREKPNILDKGENQIREVGTPFKIKDLMITLLPPEIESCDAGASCATDTTCTRKFPDPDIVVEFENLRAVIDHILTRLIGPQTQVTNLPKNRDDIELLEGKLQNTLEALKSMKENI